MQDTTSNEVIFQNIFFCDSVALTFYNVNQSNYSFTQQSHTQNHKNTGNIITVWCECRYFYYPNVKLTIFCGPNGWLEWRCIPCSLWGNGWTGCDALTATSDPFYTELSLGFWFLIRSADGFFSVVCLSSREMRKRDDITNATRILPTQHTNTNLLFQVGCKCFTNCIIKQNLSNHWSQ